MLVVSGPPSYTTDIKGFKLYCPQEASAIEAEAERVTQVRVTEPLGVITTIRSLTLGGGFGRASTRAYRIIRKAGLRRGADAAVVRSVGTGYNEHDEPIAVQVEADLYSTVR